MPNCAICQNSGIKLKNICKARIGTPLIQIKELLLQIYEEEHKLPNGIGQCGENIFLICTECETKLLEYYEATLLVKAKRKQFELIVKPPKFIDMRSTVQDMCTDSIFPGIIPRPDIKCDINETAVDANDDIDTGTRIKVKNKRFKQQSHNCEHTEFLEDIKIRIQSAKALKYCLEFFLECLDQKLYELQNADASSQHNTICESHESTEELPSEYTEKSLSDFESNEDLTKVNVYEHHRENHKEYHRNEDKIAAKYECVICKSTFAKRSSFIAHKAWHSELTCSHCKLSFMYKCDMKQHMETQHPDIKEYQCDECGNLYINSKFLFKHKILHREPRDYPCGECPMRFHQISSLKRHKLTHSGLKPHVCPVCFRRFAMKYNMRLHMKAHAKPGNLKKRPECITCGQFFTAQQLLHNHLAAGSCTVFENSL